jgi:hypothetical protein
MTPRKLPITVGAIFGFAVSAVAADLPKEGTFSGTYTATGTYKTTKIGDRRALQSFDENGVQVTNGFADHTTFHCWGLQEAADGEAVEQGFCVATDPSGDLFATKFTLDRHKLGVSGRKGTASFIGGTGKFTGVTGTIAVVLHGAEFRPLVEGTYVSYVNIEGNYKLP